MPYRLNYGEARRVLGRALEALRTANEAYYSGVRRRFYDRVEMGATLEVAVAEALREADQEAIRWAGEAPQRIASWLGLLDRMEAEDREAEARMRAATRRR
jgi:hypothetical protein